MSQTHADMVRDQANKDIARMLLMFEAEHGKVIAGWVAEATLEAVAAYLRQSVGAEAAYNILQRHADATATSAIAKRRAR